MKIPYTFVFLFGSTPTFSEALTDATEGEFEHLNILAPVLDAADTILEHIPEGTPIPTELPDKIAEDLRRHFTPDILGRCVLQDFKQYGHPGGGAIVSNGTSDDYDVFIKTGAPCLAIHLVGFAALPDCHNIWVPVPETKKRLEFIEREIQNLLNPRKAAVQ